MSNEWYVNALDVLTLLRYHGHHLVDRIADYNRFLEVIGEHPFDYPELERFQKALDNVEEYFTGKGVDNDSD